MTASPPYRGHYAPQYRTIPPPERERRSSDLDRLDALVAVATGERTR